MCVCGDTHIAVSMYDSGRTRMFMFAKILHTCTCVRLLAAHSGQSTRDTHTEPTQNPHGTLAQGSE